jgi:hypothetical protein
MGVACHDRQTGGGEHRFGARRVLLTPVAFQRDVLSHRFGCEDEVGEVGGLIRTALRPEDE